MLTTVLGRFRLIGFLEGLSYILLLGIAMPLKYALGMPEAVRVIGMAHGVLFVLYIALSIQATFVYKWPLKRLLFFWIASLLPFGTFYADYKWLRTEAQN